MNSKKDSSGTSLLFWLGYHTSKFIIMQSIANSDALLLLQSVQFAYISLFVRFIYLAISAKNTFTALIVN